MALTPRARALADEGDDALVEAAFRTGDFDPASRCLEQALAGSRASRDERTEAFALDRLGMHAHYRTILRLVAGEAVDAADVAAEEALFRQALELRQSLGDLGGTAQSLFGIGLVHQVLRDDWQSALPCFTHALALADEPGADVDLSTRSEIHRHLGFYFLVEGGDAQQAVDHLRISLDLREREGDERRISTGLVALGQAEAAVGNKRGAVALLEQAVASARSARLAPFWLHDAQQALVDVTGPASG